MADIARAGDCRIVRIAPSGRVCLLHELTVTGTCCLSESRFLGSSDESVCTAWRIRVELRVACQRRTGSVFGQQGRFRREQVSLSGVATEYVRVGDEGSRIRFHFCPACGSTVYYELEGLDEYFAIPVGAFADPAFPTPSFSVYESRKHGWVVPPAGAEHIP